MSGSHTGPGLEGSESCIFNQLPGKYLGPPGEAPAGHCKDEHGVVELDHQALVLMSTSTLHWAQSTVRAARRVWRMLFRKSQVLSKRWLWASPSPPLTPCPGPPRPAELHGDSGPGAAPLPPTPATLELPGRETSRPRPLERPRRRRRARRAGGLPAAGAAPTSLC